MLHVVDVRDAGAVEAFADTVREAHERLWLVHYLPRAVHHHFDAQSMTLAELEEVLTQWVRLAEAGDARDEGWPDDVNAVSKVGQVAAVRIVARDLARIARSRAILINAACPGLVDTDASRPWFADMAQAQTPDEAAVDVAWLASEAACRDGSAVRRACSASGRD